MGRRIPVRLDAETLELLVDFAVLEYMYSKMEPDILRKLKRKKPRRRRRRKKPAKKK